MPAYALAAPSRLGFPPARLHSITALHISSSLHIVQHCSQYKPPLKHLWVRAVGRRQCARAAASLAHSTSPTRTMHFMAPLLLLNVIHRAHILYIHRIEFVACKVLVLGNEQCRCLNEYASFLLGKNLLKLCILFFSHVIIK